MTSTGKDVTRIEVLRKRGGSYEHLSMQCDFTRAPKPRQNTIVFQRSIVFVNILKSLMHLMAMVWNKDY